MALSRMRCRHFLDGEAFEMKYILFFDFSAQPWASVMPHMKENMMKFMDAGLTQIYDAQLAHIHGGQPEPLGNTDPKALGAAMGAGAVTGGLAAAAVTGGHGWPMGAVGGALMGGIYYTGERLLTPPPPQPPAPAPSWADFRRMDQK
jgi:hypothetical protein